MAQEISSPLTGKNKVRLLQEISTRTIIQAYHKSLGLDISSYFRDLDYIQLYLCEESSYLFYYPFDIQGDDQLYEKLQLADWYYMDDKWEFEQASSYLKSGMKVLEIGAGKGAFYQIVKNKGINFVGLEYNQKAADLNTNINYPIQYESIFQHAKKFPNYYDLICSFQVLEHIAEVKSFIQSQISCLKTGGKLIISVPNNKSFINLDFEENILNYPPHHMGRWDESSLKNLTHLYNLQLDVVISEPLQKYHYGWYQRIKEKKMIKNSLLRKIYYKSGINRIYQEYIRIIAKKITGHTVLAVFTKKPE